MELPLKRVEEFLHTRVPLSKAINCQVVEATDKALKLSAPKFVNTVTDDGFSDTSVLNLCNLASWAFLQISLQRLNYKPFTSLTQANLSKNREIDSNSGNIYATCTLPGDKEWQQFLRMLSRKARAKVSLVTTLSDELGETSKLTCEYDTRDLDPA
ncbi:YiiD C-terminal domain-containing protein [Pelagicoccus sp. NFK12]|uniref:YiiD C-terminal domain-containing protein n=1 Tax=Pelagicoccus enzymogenes TaxID=2773457 RepID=A0A927FCE7_9BACT|nr:YiiD C-terminal domain-containing protein [Pelagicoccus enzymogenes]MBD5781819.1 YiiD C-terminal domain-containing protein [Pelagicoccus enzymogenes]MDQ8196575.1 YiiD C-terminal domain-containing protein [Pelagicoccus enzymogenes]